MGVMYLDNYKGGTTILVPDSVLNCVQKVAYNDDGTRNDELTQNLKNMSVSSIQKDVESNSNVYADDFRFQQDLQWHPEI